MSQYSFPGESFVWAGSLLRTGAYLVLALAMLAWLRRLRHWSLAVLAVAFLGSAGLSLISLIVWSGLSTPGTGQTNGLSLLVLVQHFGGFLCGVLLAAGAIGLLLAASQFVPRTDTGDIQSNHPAPVQPPVSKP